MILRHVALVSETQSISFSELGRVSAALQKQAVRDLGPVWYIQSTVDAFARLEDVPIGTWPIVVEDNINTPGAAGVHEDKDGQPFALVMAESGWLSSWASADAISPIALRRDTWTSSDCNSCNLAWVCCCSVKSRTKPVK